MNSHITINYQLLANLISSKTSITPSPQINFEANPRHKITTPVLKKKNKKHIYIYI